MAITESTKPSGLSICTLWSAPATCKISIWGPQDLELAIWAPDPCSRAASMAWRTAAMCRQSIQSCSPAIRVGGGIRGALSLIEHA